MKIPTLDFSFGRAVAVATVYHAIEVDHTFALCGDWMGLHPEHLTAEQRMDNRNHLCGYCRDAIAGLWST